MSSTSSLTNFVASNRDHFDHLANNYHPSHSAIELAKRAARAILRCHAFDEESTEMMDFACGAGLLSQQLAPHVKSILGIDISQGMVDLYNASVLNQGISLDEMRAVCVELRDGGEGELSNRRFGAIVCASAYHHFESIDDITCILASFLQPGGVLIVVDLVRSDDIDPDEIFPEHKDNIVAHRGGFTEEEIRKAFLTANLQAFVFQPAFNVKKRGKDVQLFIAHGSKPV